jgi:hypothetical protein
VSVAAQKSVPTSVMQVLALTRCPCVRAQKRADRDRSAHLCAGAERDGIRRSFLRRQHHLQGSGLLQCRVTHPLRMPHGSGLRHRRGGRLLFVWRCERSRPPFCRSQRPTVPAVATPLQRCQSRSRQLRRQRQQGVSGRVEQDRCARPGTYCGLDINGTANLEPGTYVIKNASLSISAQAAVKGSGVTFYLVGSGGASRSTAGAHLSSAHRPLEYTKASSSPRTAPPNRKQAER